MQPLKQTLKCLALAGTVLTVTACSGYRVGVPYQPPVRQGNWVTQSSIDQLEKGMTPHQVRYLFGSPVVQDMFKPYEWLYVYTFKAGSHKEVVRKLIVYFDKSGRVDHWDADAHLDYLPFDLDSQGQEVSEDTHKDK